MKRIILSVLLGSTMFLNSYAAVSATCITTAVNDTAKTVKSENKYPALPANVSRLFYVQRDPNANTIVYELNAPNGKLDEDEPVHAYWIRYAAKGEHAELSYIQRKFAYGLVQKPLGNDKFDIRVVSYKKYPLTLMKGQDGKYHIFATVAKKQAILNRIFVKIEGGSFWIPNVIYVELRGSDPATGQEIVERFKP